MVVTDSAIQSIGSSTKYGRFTKPGAKPIALTRATITTASPAARCAKLTGRPANVARGTPAIEGRPDRRIDGQAQCV